MNELEKFADAAPAMQVIRDFLEWCDEQKIELAEWLPSGYRMMPRSEGREQMLQRYFGIDPVRLEKERRALLKKAAA